jgi:hypothetical protein
VSGEASHEANQALDLFLGEIGVRRHGAGFADGDASALDHGPDPVVHGSSLPSRIGQILWFLSQTGGRRSIPFPASPMTHKTAGLKKLLSIRLIGLIK